MHFDSVERVKIVLLKTSEKAGKQLSTLLVNLEDWQISFSQFPAEALTGCTGQIFT